MDARKHLIIIKGKDQTDSVASFRFHDGKCEVIYTSEPNKVYDFQSGNVEILPLQKIIDPAKVIVTANGQTISGIDELLDFGAYYRIIRSGKKDLLFRRSEVQLQQNCLTDGKNQAVFQYFKETAAVISLVAENGSNILSMQYDKIQQVSEDTVLSSYLAPQKEIKAPRMPEAIIYPFGLNQSQKLAVERALSSKISIIQGPPGTGKTSVALKSMVEEFLSDHPQKTLLLMAYTNRAVDEICHTLSAINPAPEYIRIGQELNCAPDFRPRLMKHVIGDATSRKEIYEKLAPVRVFAGTISSLCSQTELFSLKVIDVAIIDEASQVLEPQLLPLLCATTTVNRGDYNLNRLAIGKFILIGDHKQLPAVVSQPREMSRVTEDSLQAIGLTDCRNSLFERLHRLSSLQGTKNIVEMLHRQGRMHPSICEFVNRNYYNGGLDAVPLPHQQEPLAFGTRPDDDRWTAFVGGTRMAFISVQADEAEYYTKIESKQEQTELAQSLPSVGDSSKSNKREAETVARLVHTLCQLHSRSGIPFSPCKQIGIIVPFRAQIAMIRKALAERHIPDTADITIDTVERYQGSQRDIIIFSTTVSHPYQLSILSEPIMTDGREIDRKLNVALTRARKQFFMTGNETLLRNCTAYREFLDFLSKEQILRL